MKTARAIEPNAGTRREYAKRVNRLVNKFLDLMTDEILLHVADAGDLVAQDWSLSKPTRKADREKLRRIRARVLAAWKRDPAAFAADIDDYVSRNIVRWTGYLDRSADKLAQWVARSIAADVTNAQKQAYLSAGISPEVFKDKWTIPVVRQHISPTAARLIPSIVEESVGNIERLALSKASRLQQVITEGLAQGHTVSKVKQTLRSFGGFDESTATSWAIDQPCRITQSILRANDAELGVTKGVWIHVPGQYTSRETHRALHGKTFDLDVGLYDKDVGANVVPGELRFCRCIYRPVLPFNV